LNPQRAGLRAVVNALPIVVYAFDGEGRILLAEGKALEAIGSSSGQLVGSNVRDVFADDPNNLLHIDRALAGAANDGAVSFTRNGRVYQVWYRPTLSEAGAVTVVTGLSLDITEHHNSAHQLGDATRSLDRMLENLPVALFGVSAAGTLTLARGRILPEEITSQIGQPLAVIGHRYPEIVAAVKAALAGQDVTLGFSRGDRYFDILVSPRREGEEIEGALGAIIEVTEQRRAADAAIDSEQKAWFLATVSHELRTPLNSMLGFADLLVEQVAGRLNDRQYRYASNIRTSGQQLLSLINDLLDLTKTQAGRAALGTEPLNLWMLISETVEQMRPLAESRGVELLVGRQTPAIAYGDGRRVSQILLNLVSNAVKFTPRSGRVTIATSRLTDFVVVKVADNGIGIASDDRERIFEGFYQVPQVGAALTSEGTGLGLALSRQLARAMGGDLTVRSKIGNGSVFRFDLPLRKPAQASPADATSD
jgi:PAS domain S-box-containing protein